MSSYTGPYGSLTPLAVRNLQNSLTQQTLPSLFRNVYYLDPANGYDANVGTSPGQAFQTLATAYNACVSGYNDCVALIGNGSTTATARVDASFTWAKNATHLIGLSSGVNISNRSRIAPSSATTAFTPYFTISGSGCLFQNVEIFDGFTTGTTAQIALTITGGRNLFQNCHLAGMGDATSAGDAGSRVVKIVGTGENQFLNCTFGVDTIARTAANATVEFASGTARNVFSNSRFISYLTGSGSGAYHGLATGVAAMDRFQAFENCNFYQSYFSGAGVAMAQLLHASSASAGGEFILQNPSCAGVTAYGDATTLALTIVVGPAVNKLGGQGVVGT